MPKRATKVKAEAVTPELPPENTCSFCKKTFLTERGAMVHACEKKRRWLWKDEKYAVIGFRSFQRFYEISLRSKKPKSHEDFIDSKYYLGFIKFGRYVVDINAVDPLGFVDFLIKAQVKLEDWTAPWAYETWVREMGKKEGFERALERSILLMEQWAKENDNEWINFFREASPALATKWIRSGRISPWILYTVGEDLLDRMSNEQLLLIKEWIDPRFWPAKLRDHADDVEIIKATLREAGV